MSNVAFNFTENPINISFKKISRQPLPFKDELVETAKYIKSKTTKPIMLVISGGIDGETAALSFMKAGIQFEVMTCIHKSKTNYKDASYAKEFCERHDITQHFIELDEEDFFFNSGFERYISQDYISNNLFNYLQLFLLEKVEEMGYTAVFGGGDQMYKLHNNELCLLYPTPFINSLKWCTRNSAIHFPYFFITTPELTASYMKEPIIDHFISNPGYYGGIQDFEFNLEKTVLFHNTYPSMPKRYKYTGFESILDKRLRVQAELKSRFPEVSNVYLPIDTVKKELGIT